MGLFALNHCEMLVFSYKNFRNLENRFPNVFSKILSYITALKAKMTNFSTCKLRNAIVDGQSWFRFLRNVNLRIENVRLIL